MIPKLIRDKIPGQIAARGASCRTERVAQDDRRDWLIWKLGEECREVEDAREDPEALQRECADVLEVLLALVADADRRIGAVREPSARLEELRLEKLERNGGFTDGVVLLDLVEPDAGPSRAEV